MNCSNITTGYCGSLCHNNSGGIAEIFVTNKSNIDAITYNADESIADITLNHNKHWYYVVPNVESSNWVETVVSEESNNVLYYEQTISIVLGSTQQALRNFIESTASLPLAFIILDDNGRYFYFDDSRLNGGETGSGTSWSDLNGATLEYYSRSKEPIFEADVEHSTNLKQDLEDAKNPNPPVQPEHYIHYVSSVPLSGVWIDTNTDSRFNTWDDSTGDGYVYIYDGVTTIGGGSTTDHTPFYHNADVTLIDITNTEFTSIGDFAFEGCTNLTDFAYNENITSFGNYCFYQCESIPNFEFSDNVESIGQYAFYGCSELADVSIGTGIENISLNAFAYTALTSFDVPSTITAISPFLLKGTPITSITIPSNILSVGRGAFQDCSLLTSVAIPNSVENIYNDAFNGCSLLDSLSIGNSVEMIGNGAFEDCSAIEELTLPDSLELIGQNAFNGCDDLMSVYIERETPPILVEGNFTATGDTLYVPYSLLDVYTDSSAWRNAFTFIRPDGYSYVNVVAGENGSVSGSGWYLIGSTITISATADSHYHFTAWNDGDTNATRSITVGSSDVTFTASFAIDRFLLNVGVNDSSYGSASGTGYYDYGTQVQIEATPNEHYHFTQWQDGDVTNPRTVTVTSNMTFVATLAIDTFVLTVNTDSSYGTASGSGTYNYGTQVQIEATPNEHYHFTVWNDGVATNPRTVTVTANATYTASIAIDRFLINVGVNDSDYGTVTGTGYYDYGTQVAISATPNEHYHFSQWQDGNTDNPRTITVTGNASYVATLAVDTFTLSVSANDASYGTTTGSGTYEYGTSVQISASPNVGYLFMQWNDGIANNPRTITVTGNASYVATFAVRNVYPIPYVGDIAVSGRWVNDNTNTNRNTYDVSTGEGVIYVYDNVTTIGGSRSTDDSPFYGSSVTEVDLNGANITNIDDYAFADSSLTDLYIDSSVPPTLGTDVFDSSVTVHVPYEYLSEYESDWGSVVDVVTDDRVILYNSTQQATGNWVANNTDTTRNTYDALTGDGILYLNDNVTPIGGGTSTNYSPFYQNGNVTSVDMSDSRMETIGSYAFYNCTGLTSVTIPNSVTTIGSGAFNNCSSLPSVTIPNSVTTIGGAAFYNCTGLTSVTIPNSVTTIGFNVFTYCAGLTSVTISSSLTGIPDYTFADCTGLTSVTIPNSVNGIGDEAFNGCTSLMDVYVSAPTPPYLGTGNFTAIGDTLHTPSATITTAYMNATNWGTAFTNYTPMSAVIRYNAGTQATGGWVNNNTDTTRNTYDALTGNGILYLNDGVSTLGPAYASDPTPTDATPFYNKADLVSVDLSNSELTTLANRAFYSCTGLTSIVFPDTLTTISGGLPYCSALTDLTLPEGLITISDSACISCTSLSSVTIPSTVTTVGNNSFQNCNNLKTVTCYATTPPTLGTNNFSVSGDTLYVPESAFNAYTSDSSWNGAFTNISVITDDKVISYKATTQASGNWVTTNTDTASNKFNNDRGVLYLNSGVTSIGGEDSTDNSPFYNKTDVVSIDITDTSINTIAKSAFMGCSNLTSISLDNGVLTEIAINGIRGCTILPSVTIPNTVTTLGDNVFRSNKAMTTANIPSGVTSIPDNAFNECQSLASIDIPDTVTSIGISAFEGCQRLKSITIGTGVTSIGRGAFHAYYPLEVDVYCKATTPPTLDSSNAFAFNYAQDTLHVPASSWDAYCNNSTWNGAFNHIKIIGETKYMAYKSTSQISNSNSWVTNHTTTSKNKWNNTGKRGLLYVTNTSIGGGDGATYSPFYSVKTAIQNVDFSGAFPNVVIGSNTFQNCTSLVNVRLDPTVTQLRPSSFYGCTGLTKLLLPSTINEVANSATNGCSNLKTVWCYATSVPTLGTSNFTASSDTLYVPSASLNSYKNNSAWNSAFTTKSAFLQWW